jgi:phage terminase large subunit
VCDWATGEAINDGVDCFSYDADGMGTGLKRQVSDAFKGKQITNHAFRGSLSGSAQDNADKPYIPIDDDDNKQKKDIKTYAETFLNNRSQFYMDLADRCYNTYKCVVRGEYIDPEKMISFDTDGIDNVDDLKTQLCRIPKKPNSRGLLQILSKADMKKLGIPSPNEADSVMMSLFNPPAVTEHKPIEFDSMW